MPSQWEFQGEIFSSPLLISSSRLLSSSSLCLDKRRAVGPVEGVAAADQLWIARWIMHRLGELFRLEITFDPKGIYLVCSFFSSPLSLPSVLQALVSSTLQPFNSNCFDFNCFSFSICSLVSVAAIPSSLQT